MLVDMAGSGRILATVKQSWMKRGPVITFLAMIQVVFRPLIRLRRRLVFSASLPVVDCPSTWESDVQLLVIGPENVADLSPELLASLDPNRNQEEWSDLLQGNRLFVVMQGAQWLHRGSIRLIDKDTLDRKAVFFGKLRSVPEIRWCETVPGARGRGLYRRVLNEQLRYLGDLGHKEAVLCIMAENTPSIKGATAAGFQLCRTLHDWIIFNSLVFQRAQENKSAYWRVFRQ
jgi:RimJ/RimL family protein N-acetyltransferase